MYYILGILLVCSEILERRISYPVTRHQPLNLRLFKEIARIFHYCYKYIRLAACDRCSLNIFENLGYLFYWCLTLNTISSNFWTNLQFSYIQVLILLSSTSRYVSLDRPSILPEYIDIYRYTYSQT